MKLTISKRSIIALAASIAMIISSLEATITAAIMPYIINDLGGLNLYRWITASYLLANTISMPLFGRLADCYGRKNIYLIALLIFFIGSILCGLSVNMLMLIFSRIIQGIGAGGLIVLSITILGDLYTAYERAKIQANLSVIWNAAGAAGPFIGAIIIKFLNWRYAFYINIPFCIISAIAINKNLKNDSQKSIKSFDKLGFLLFAIASISILLSVENGISIFSIIFSVFMIIIFIAYEKNIKDQIIPFSVVKNRFVLYPSIASFFSRAVSFSIMTYLPLIIILQGKTNPIKIGSVLTPIILGSFIGNYIAGYIARSYTLKFLGIMMQIFYFFSILICSILIISNVISNILYIDLLFLGVGLGGSSMIGMLVMQINIEKSERATGSSILAFSRSMGGAVGVGLLGAMISRHSNILNMNIQEDIYKLMDSINSIFLTLPIISLFGVLAATKYTNIKIHKDIINNSNL